MPRSGTTYLYVSLADHPSVFVPYRKESYYFSVNYSKGPKWFDSLYKGSEDSDVAADINPMYFFDPNALGRVLEYDADAKFVLGVREPVDFAISQYKNMLAQGHEISSVVELVDGYDWQLTPHESLRVALKDNYTTKAIKSMAAELGDNLLLYDFQLFRETPLAILQAIEKFLEIPPYFNQQNYVAVPINASTRRNSVLLSSALSNQRVLDFIYTVTPKPIIRQLRKMFEHASARATPVKENEEANAEESVVTPEERAYLENNLSSDSEFYKAVFAKNQLLFGSQISA